MKMRASSWVVLACLGCASKPPPPAAPADAAVKSEPVAQEPAPDLSPVTAPDDLVLIGRLSRPRLLVETVASWIGLPVKVTDLLPSELRAAETVVAWDAPVEVAAILDRHSSEKVPTPVVAVSVGLTSLPQALEVVRARGLSATRVAPAVYRVQVDDEVTCAIAASVGAVSARLICGGDWMGMEDLLPYATRGLPNEKLGGDDLFLELRAAPLQRRYSQEIGAVRLLAGLLLRQGQTDHARLDRALTDAAYGLADELKAIATDVDKLQILARLDEGNKVLEVGSSLSFAKQSSFTAQLTADMGQRAAFAPEVFWELPRSAAAATYSVGADQKRLGQLASAGAELLDAYLDQQKASQALRRRARSVVEALPLFLSPGAHVSGSVAAKDNPTPIEKVHQGLGWGVSVIEARADKLSKLFLDLEAGLTDRFVRTQLGTDVKVMPKLRHRALRVAGFPAPATVFTLEALPSLLTRATDGASPPAGKKAAPEKPGVLGALLFAPDGERTWVAFGADEKTAGSTLESVRAAQGGRLKDMPELASLGTSKSVGAGFITLESLLGSLQAALHGRIPSGASVFSHAPNHGRSPALTRMEVVPAGSGVVARASWRLPKGAFEDVGGVAPFLLPKAD